MIQFDIFVGDTEGKLSPQPQGQDQDFGVIERMHAPPCGNSK